VFISALPQSTVEVEKAFSRWNNNKNKLRDRLAVYTLEAIIKSSENFPVTLKPAKDLHIYMEKQGKQILKNLKILKLLMLSLMRLFPCELQPAGELQEVMLKICCERCWLILEAIR